ncbi:MAG TPA: polysaccharide pyruvyl transferase CsaB [Bacillota bacterium]|nr:polysaccharide pyruvyl transferase CsaB [Bacillota bacterium]
MGSKRIMMSGYFGFDNAGDEAICSAIIQTLRGMDPSLEFVVLSGNPEKTREKYQVEAIPRMDLKQIYRQLKKVDLFISGGGSLLQDKTGNLTIPYYLTMIHMARMLKVPVAIFAQGIGPVDRPFFKRWIGRLFKKLDYVSVRDQDSKQLLINWNVPPGKIDEVVDPVFLLPSEGKQKGLELLAAEGITVGKPPILFSVRRWKEGTGDFQILAELGDWLIEQGEEVLFLPFHYPDDLEASIEVISLMKKSAQLLQRNYHPSELMDIVSSGKAMVGMRLHALIFAAARNIPCIGISYDPKIDSFLQQLGLQPAGFSGKLSILTMQDAVSNALEQKHEMLDRAKTLREKALLPAKRVMDLLNN